MSGKRSKGRWFVLLILAGVGLGALLPLFLWQPVARGGDTDGEPEVQVEDISELPRVPVYGTGPEADPLGTNEKSVTVTLWPSPLPAGKKVTVQISTIIGTGGATFDDGSTSKDITQTTTLKVRGTINSSVKDNMKISATYEGNGMSRTFTVSTWPYDLKNTLLSKNLYFGLKVTVTWKSESGKVADLTNVLMREYIEVTQMGSNPPFTITPPIIFIQPPNGGPATGGTGTDRHHYSAAGVNWTGVQSSRVKAQQYQFKDVVLNTEWTNGVLGTATITREVKTDPDPAGTYIFITSKTGPGTFSDSCPEKP